ncbi:MULTISPECIES: hypothetical protein [Streptomyces]|uniref:hypothetical protein n=1 Tax=Streptomyces TaxID=1883 RepID=UPI0004AA17F0|nr:MULTISPECIES: hypothetical protein [Streptomyces]
MTTESTRPEQPDELTRLATVAFIATKAAFIRAMEQICDEAGADLGTLLLELEKDDRIGPLRNVGGFDLWEYRAFLAVLKAEESEALEFFRTIDVRPQVPAAARAHLTRHRGSSGEGQHACLTPWAGPTKRRTGSAPDSPRH